VESKEARSDGVRGGSINRFNGQLTVTIFYFSLLTKKKEIIMMRGFVGVNFGTKNLNRWIL